MIDNKTSLPVTVIARHNILAGKEAVFEHWLLGIEKSCQRFSGFIGTQVIRPIDDEIGTYVCIFHFDNFSNLQLWMDSTARQEWLAKSVEFSAAEVEYERYHKLEFMFSNKQARKKRPSSLKMTILTIVGLSLPVHFVPPFIASFIAWPAAITIVSLVIIVPMMVYIIMPLLSRFSSRWL